jgi:hypothetical protein
LRTYDLLGLVLETGSLLLSTFCPSFLSPSLHFKGCVGIFEWQIAFAQKMLSPAEIKGLINYI